MKQKTLPVEVLWPGSVRPDEVSAIFAVGPAGAYLKTQFATATPTHLQMLLYDGVIRLCRDALKALDDGDTRAAADRLAHTRTILRQLQRGMRREVSPLLYEELSDLYERAHRRLIEADFYRTREPVSETISMLTYRRPAWSAFVEELCKRGVVAEAPSSRVDWIA